MVEDCYAGDNGVGGGIAKGIRVANYKCGVWGIPGHCMIDQKSMNAYGRRQGGLMQTYSSEDSA
jgi:hypothetical protein